MASNFIQNSLSNGEYSPELYGRTDIAGYAAAVREMRNLYVLPHGGAKRREGTRYVCTLKTSGVGRLQEFVFSTEQPYVLVFEDRMVRIIRDAGSGPRLEDIESKTVAAAQVDTDGNSEPSEFEVVANHYFTHRLGTVSLVNDAGDAPNGLDQTGTTDYYIKLPKEMRWNRGDVNPGSDFILFDTDLNDAAQHKYTSGQGPFKIKTTEHLEPNLDTDMDVYVNADSSTTVKLYNSASNAKAGLATGLIDLTGTGDAGVHTLYPTEAYKRTKFQLALSGDADTDAETFSDAGTGTNTFATNGTAAGNDRYAEITVPYLAEDLDRLQFAQSADLLYITHKEYPVGKISRFGHGEWLFDEVTLSDGPYLTIGEGETVAATNLQSSHDSAVIEDTIGDPVTITASEDLFVATDVGRKIRMQAVSVWGEAVIRQVETTKIVRVDILKAIDGQGITLNWRLGTFGDSSIWGYPRSVTFFEQRLALGGSIGAPNTFWASVSASFEEFPDAEIDNTVLETQSLVYTLGQGKLDAIRWMVPLRSLLFGTSDGVWPLQPTSFLDAATPGNLQVKPSAADPASYVVPVRIGSAVLYLSPSRKQVQLVAYVFDADSYQSSHANIVAGHLTESPIREIKYQREPGGAFWMPRDDGVVVGFTYEREQNVAGFHQHIFGGNFAGNTRAEPEAESVAVIPSFDTERDEPYFLVNRDVAGTPTRMVEFITRRFEQSDMLEDAKFLDCHVYDDTASSSTLTGLDHLEGETVSVFVDGSRQTDKLVSGGSITLDSAGTKKLAGYKYRWRLKTMELNPQNFGGGTHQGHLKAVVGARFRVLNSLGGEFHMEDANSGGESTEPEILRFAGPLQYDASSPLFTGDVEIKGNTGYFENSVMVIEDDEPFPMTVLAIISEVLTER
jgi:hypothetical protein